ncbi:MAG: hypothetical protein M0011_01235 [Elusimicrobia bacterium]|nr:hypothetical protein [Elusimicrobiota bacterium]
MKNILFKFVFAAGCFAAVLAAGAPEAGAVPVFARKYGFSCNMCHSGFPRLNDFGVRYRQNGYRLPGREGEERTVLQGHSPVALRTSAGYNYDRFHNAAGATVRQFQLNGVDLLSGGLLSRDAGYIFVYVPEVAGSGGVAAQTGTLEMASVVFPELGTTWLNVRVGRFEPAYAAFSVKRHLSVSPYEAYDFGFKGGAPFSDTREGVEVTGHGGGFGYAAGAINAPSPAGSSQTSTDLYARAEKVFGEGEGQTAGYKVGLTGYTGRARSDASLPQYSRRGYSRAGVDASLNYLNLNLALQYLNGTDDKTLWGRTRDLTYSAGFAELSYFPSVSLTCFARYDEVGGPRSAGAQISRWTLGGRYYPADNVALHPEYSFRKQGQPGGAATEAFFTARVDFAF